MIELTAETKISDIKNARPAELEQFFRSENWISPDEHYTASETAGSGNMNVVQRIFTSHKSFIIKQSYPWVNKYPQVAAPLGRVNTEAECYALLQSSTALSAFIPRLIGAHAANNIIALEDLGAASDFTTLYSGEELNESHFGQLLTFLNILHSSFAHIPPHQRITNHPMRALNHEHIFRFPFRHDNGMDLNTLHPGMGDAFSKVMQHTELQEKITQLGQAYLADGDTLQHGDYYPAAWLRSSGTLRIIDFEFCFFGHREFDPAVMAAHLLLSGADKNVLSRIAEHYHQPLQAQLYAGFAGTEILRRLMGLAQLPLSLTALQKQDLIHFACRLILHPESTLA